MLPLLVFPLSLMSNKMGGEDKIQKMGKHLMHGGGLPCLTPSCQQGGERWSTPGWRSLGEVGGGGFRTSFLIFTQSSCQVSLCAVGWQPRLAMYQFSAEERRGVVFAKVKVSSIFVFIVYLVDSCVGICQCLIRPGGRKYSCNFN